MRSVAFVNGRSHAAALMTTPGSAAERLLQTELFVTDVCAGASAGGMGLYFARTACGSVGPGLCRGAHSRPARAPAGLYIRRCCLLLIRLRLLRHSAARQRPGGPPKEENLGCGPAGARTLRPRSGRAAAGRFSQERSTSVRGRRKAEISATLAGRGRWHSRSLRRE